MSRQQAWDHEKEKQACPFPMHTTSILISDIRPTKRDCPHTDWSKAVYWCHVLSACFPVRTPPFVQHQTNQKILPTMQKQKQLAACHVAKSLPVWWVTTTSTTPQIKRSWGKKEKEGKERKGKERKGKVRTGQDRTGKTPPCSGVPYGKQACETRRIYCCFKVLNQVNGLRERAYPIWDRLLSALVQSV